MTNFHRISIAAVVATALAFLVIVGAASAAVPQRVDFGETEMRTPGVDQAVDTRDAPSTPAPSDGPGAEVWAQGEVEEAEIRARGPSCDFETDARLDRACDRGGVETQAPRMHASYGYSIDLVPSEEGRDTESSSLAVSDVAAPFVFEGTSPIVFYAVAAGGLGLGALYAVWRVARFGLFGLIPLYSHIRDDQILDDPNRASIYNAIREEPGVSTKDIADRLDLAWGTVTHHLVKLERRRFVVSKKYGKYRRYFVNGHSPEAPDKDAVAVLRVHRTAEVARFIEAHPGSSQKAVGESLGLSSSTILWHVKRLIAAGLVDKVRDGKEVRYYATGNLAGAPSATQPGVAAGSVVARAAATTAFYRV